MKEIDILRHAEKDATGALTTEGKLLAWELAKRLGSFEIIISSPKPRAVETVTLLTGKQPVIDDGAGAIDLTPAELRDTHEQGKLHRFGVAGVLFDNEEYRSRIMTKGEGLVRLIETIFDKLSDNGRALIVSHDGVMVAAKMIIENTESTRAKETFKPLQGFRVFGNWSVERIEL